MIYIVPVNPFTGHDSSVHPFYITLQINGGKGVKLMSTSSFKKSVISSVKSYLFMESDRQLGSAELVEESSKHGVGCMRKLVAS